MGKFLCMRMALSCTSKGIVFTGPVGGFLLAGVVVVGGCFVIHRLTNNQRPKPSIPAK